jgi:hypothetical protein
MHVECGVYDSKWCGGVLMTDEGWGGKIYVIHRFEDVVERCKY